MTRYYRQTSMRSNVSSCSSVSDMDCTVFAEEGKENILTVTPAEENMREDYCESLFLPKAFVIYFKHLYVVN